MPLPLPTNGKTNGRAKRSDEDRARAVDFIVKACATLPGTLGEA
jgi:hypothetical protein